ncbi:hypothetical protein TanjilG_06404 [Lupinus angustifolius]|uniref:Uncharacterized protein n=1 Tax=Lupinus angustifolius TaxID=3871 RepID=A0A4P1RVN8_LUPAN|nr:hypothetical protein TanjilG_06404 [Lupinus angustifolius]
MTATVVVGGGGERWRWSFQRCRQCHRKGDGSRGGLRPKVRRSCFTRALIHGGRFMMARDGIVSGFSSETTVGSRGNSLPRSHYSLSFDL